jgi:nucleoid-associated protein EbfC
MKNLGNLMKQAQQMQAKMGEMQTMMADMEVSGASGAGMVSVVLNGKHELKKITLDKSVVDPTEIEVLEDLIIAAVNDARQKIDLRLQDEMSKMTGGLNLPAGFKLPF